MNKYLVIIIGALLAYGAVMTSQNNLNRGKAARWETNFVQARTENSVLKVTASEFKAMMYDSLTVLRDSLHLKPKQVVKVVVVDHYYVDTVNHTVTTVVDSTCRDKYLFSNVQTCYSVKGFITLTPPMPTVTITEVQYNTKITEVYSKRRGKHKILGITTRWFGKWQFRKDVVSSCGETTTQDIEITKD